MPMPAAAATSSGMRQAPSPNEKVVCACKWTKLIVSPGSIERLLEGPRLGHAVVPQIEHASLGAHPSVRTADVAVVFPPACLEDPRLEHALYAVAPAPPHKAHRVALPLVPADGDGGGRAVAAGPGVAVGAGLVAGGGSAARHVVLLVRAGRLTGEGA